MIEISSEPILTESGEENTSKNSKKCVKMPHQQDSKWSVLVCGCAVFSQAAVLGPLLCFGVLFPSLSKTFNADKATTAGVNSIFTGLFFLSGPIAGVLCTRYQHRTVNICGLLLSSTGFLISSFASNIELLYFTYGAFLGVGISFIQISNFSILAQYFNKYRNLASAMALAGSTFGYFAMAPASQKLLENIGLSNTYRVFAGISFLPVLINVWVYDPNVELPYKMTMEEVHPKSSIRNIVDFSILKNRRYVCYLISMLFYFWSFFTPNVHIARHCLDIGISEDRSSKLYMCNAAASVTGRLVSGKLGDWKRVNKLHIFQISAIVMGIMTAILPSFTTIPQLMVYMGILGFSEGSIAGSFPITIFEIVGPQKYSQAIGLYFFFVSGFASAGPATSGFLADKTGNYNLAFYITAGSYLIAGISNVFMMKYAENKKEITVDEQISLQLENVIIYERITVL